MSKFKDFLKMLPEKGRKMVMAMVFLAPLAVMLSIMFFLTRIAFDSAAFPEEFSYIPQLLAFLVVTVEVAVATLFAVDSIKQETKEQWRMYVLTTTAVAAFGASSLVTGSDFKISVFLAVGVILLLARALVIPVASQFQERLANPV